MRCAALVVVSGCGFAPAPISGASGDGPVDIDAKLGDAPAVCSMWHPHDFMPCAVGSPQGDVVLDTSGTPYTYDTTTAGGELRDKNGVLVISSPLTMQQADSTTVALLSIASLRVDSGVVWNVIGTKPLLIASWGSILIAGTIDVGSHTTQTDGTAFIQQPTQIGANANANCGTLSGSPGFDAAHSGGSGGGGGGAYRGAGGQGAVGDMNCVDDLLQPTTPCPRPGGAGAGALVSPPMSMHGGCAGGASGTAGSGATSPATSTTISAAGAGGGAIELDAFTSITVTGAVLAGGSSGAGCPLHTAAGGGGGGSGGYIGFDAMSIAITGVVAANGGGGGGSAPFTNPPAHGNPGTDGQGSTVPAAGGAVSGGSCGLAGAVGGALGTIAGGDATGNDACGGGGGGGGVGFLLAWSATIATTGSTISPDLIILQ